MRTHNNPAFAGHEEDRSETVSPKTHHHIGKSQNNAEHIGTFLSANTGDPAVKVQNLKSMFFRILNNIEQDFLPRLKKHLLPRLKDMMKKEALGQDAVDVDSYAELMRDHSLHTHTSQLFFKHDRLYKHNLFRINYTTYDIRRAQDTININSSRRDIMVLNDTSDEDEGCGQELQRFLYARVIGVFHTNIVFTGPGSLDYQPRRMDFLWVRWFRPSPSIGWDSRRLDCVDFFPVEDECAFGFLDPNDVVRACHIMPRHALGRSAYAGRSKLAKDKDDWQYYNVNRYLLVFGFDWFTNTILDLWIATCSCDFTGAWV